MTVSDFFAKKPVIVALHVLGWCVFYYKGIMPYLTETFERSDIILNISYHGWAIATFYLFYYLIWPKTLIPGNYGRVVPGVIAGLVFFIGGRYVLEEILFPLIFGFDNYYIEGLFYIDDNFFRGFQMIIFSLAVYLFVDRFRRDKKREKEERIKSEAELSFLRSQINPHFLFNMLNYLHTEAYLKDEQLADSILQLSELLRYSTQKSNSKGALLKDELHHLKNYIELYRKRFGEECYVKYEQAGHSTDQRIEPLLFIPFVENAFKHGIYTDPNAPIHISVDVEENKVRFVCQNKISNHQKDSVSGIGLDNVNQRLELIYPDRHTCQVVSTNDIFTADLTIQLS